MDGHAMKTLVGDFSEEELRNGTDKTKIAEKKQETGLKFIESKVVRKKGVPYMRVWVSDVCKF